jgi:hypothetical protein
MQMGKRSFIYISLIFLLLGGLREGKGEEKESFYSKSNRLILRLEHIKNTAAEGPSRVKEEIKSDGTAFFVQWADELYVVSARHVTEGAYDLRAMVRIKNLKTGAIRVAFLNLPRKRWVYHPNQGDRDTRSVDVAAMKINWLEDHQVMTFLYEMEGQKEGGANQLSLQDPEPPQPVLVFGFPSEIGFELTEQRPMGRVGIVSMVAGNKFLKMGGKYVAERACLIDIGAFPGNSGSPVINQFSLQGEPQIKLLGVLIGTNPKRRYAVMEPVSRVRETLEIARKQSLEGLAFWALTEKSPESP